MQKEKQQVDESYIYLTIKYNSERLQEPTLIQVRRIGR